ncbi:hypothetical protein Athai_48270 [Actinocatenispora thailandica]|uniref:Mersacidin/lichenicidin family type 2 lantibiotic n=1 Tax=Actinocatenispora thailandica TaxID=227318 RepID=A0A7R7HZG2_9ACTN|nr:hypothetical protein [Actinocatenispora thailandica]BCJ37324.1 hypothetical protein Athai_48270 [Actinocatenispora thailandica]
MTEDIVRSWKDPDLPSILDHPAGRVELADPAGGRQIATEGALTWGCCPDQTGVHWSCLSAC